MGDIFLENHLLKDSAGSSLLCIMIAAPSTEEEKRLMINSLTEEVINAAIKQDNTTPLIAAVQASTSLTESHAIEAILTSQFASKLNFLAKRTVNVDQYNEDGGIEATEEVQQSVFDIMYKNITNHSANLERNIAIFKRILDFAMANPQIDFFEQDKQPFELPAKEGPAKDFVRRYNYMLDCSKRCKFEGNTVSIDFDWEYQRDVFLDKVTSPTDGKSPVKSSIHEGKKIFVEFKPSIELEEIKLYARRALMNLLLQILHQQ